MSLIKPAPSIELLKYCRRLVTQPHKDVPGCFAGFFRKDLKDGYPHGAAPDDRWLSAYMGTRFGLAAIRMDGDVAVNYTPPMTLTDLRSQIDRYCRVQAVIER